MFRKHIRDVSLENIITLLDRDYATNNVEDDKKIMIKLSL